MPLALVLGWTTSNLALSSLPASPFTTSIIGVGGEAESGTGGAAEDGMALGAAASVDGTITMMTWLPKTATTTTVRMDLTPRLALPLPLLRAPVIRSRTLADSGVAAGEAVVDHADVDFLVAATTAKLLPARVPGISDQ